MCVVTLVSSTDQFVMKVSIFFGSGFIGLVDIVGSTITGCNHPRVFGFSGKGACHGGRVSLLTTEVNSILRCSRPCAPARGTGVRH